MAWLVVIAPLAHSPTSTIAFMIVLRSDLGRNDDPMAIWFVRIAVMINPFEEVNIDTHNRR